MQAGANANSDRLTQEARAEAVLKQQKEENGRAYAAGAVPDLMIKSGQLLEDMKANATNDAAGFVPQYLSKIDETFKAAIEQAPDEQSKKYLTAHVQSIRSSVGQQAVHFEASALQSYRTKLAQDGAEKWTSIVGQDPGQYSAAITAIEQTLPAVGPQVREKLMDDAKKRLLTAAAGTAVLRDPAGTLKAINTALNIPQPATANPFKVSDQVADAPTGLQKLIGAIYAQESNSGSVDTSQPNYAGAIGPMQVTRPTFDGLKRQGLIPATADFNNPDDTTAAGVSLLKSLWSKYQGDPQKVAAAYYAGEKAVNADGTINDFRDLQNPKAPSTLQYAAKVVSRLGRTGPEPLKPLEPANIRPGEQATPTGVAWVDNMTPDALLHYRQQAATELQRTNSTARFGLERTEKDMQAQALSGIVPRNVPSRDEYVAAFGRIEGTVRYQENVSNVLALGQSMSALQSASPAERQAIIAGAAPVQGEGFAATAQRQAQLVHANQIIEKQLQDDPAVYASRNSSRVKAAYQSLNSLPPGASMEQQRAAVDRYAAESISEQQRLGAKRPQLLTDDQASKIALSFQSQKEGGDSAAKLMSNLQQQWGSYFPNVMQQLQRDDKLAPEVMVIPSMKDPASKERMARLAVTPEKDLKERLAPGDLTDLHAQMISTMEPFWNTLAVQGGGERTYGTVQRATEKLAMSYMAQGKSAKQAAQQAYDETVGHGYQFEDSYRVPKGEMPDQVVQGVKSLMRHVEDIPVSFPAGPPGMRMEDANKQYLDAIKTNPVFVTNPDESGVLMYVQTERGLSPVRGPAGQISYTWKQLRDEYQTTVGSAFVGYRKP